FGARAIHSARDRDPARAPGHAQAPRPCPPSSFPLDPMRLAHVRDRHGPAGAPWRLVAAIGVAPRHDETGTRWLELEVARRRAVASDPGLAHNSVLHRQPITTLDDVLRAGLRADSLRDLV